MALIDKMKEADEQHSISEVLSSIDSLRAAVEQTLQSQKEIIDRQNELTQAMNQLSTSQPPAQPSTLPLDAVTKSRLAEIEKTLAAVAEQLSTSEAVKLPDGSSVRRSDLDAHTMMKTISATLQTMTSSSAELADAVRKRGNIKIDTSALTAHVVAQLDQQLARAVAPRLDAVGEKLDDYEQRVDELGAAKVGAVAESLDELDEKVGRVDAKVQEARKLLDWRGLGLVAAALLPLAIIGLSFAIVLGLAGNVLGIGPLAAWVWSCFAEADVWWVRLLIVAGALAGIAGLVFLVIRGGKRLFDWYRGW